MPALYRDARYAHTIKPNDFANVSIGGGKYNADVNI